MQVSLLVRRMKEESEGGSESPTRKRLREKIASLSQPQLFRAADALTIIWHEVMRLLDLPMPEPKPPSIVKPTFFFNWHRVKLALKSIPTETFIDLRFFAYNAVCNGLPVDPRFLYTSSIAIERWGVVVATRELEFLSKFTRP